MAKNKSKTAYDSGIMVELIEENELSSEMGEAFASYMLNPTVVWAKFILTDDRKNANGMRIPKEEFQNLMKSGIHMPVKMAIGEIKDGHEGSEPLGVITHLKEITNLDGSSAIVALAALWSEERPSDVSYIKERFKNSEPVNISWEILYSDSEYNDSYSSMDLYDTILRAATIVGIPAYEGRTQFLEVAAKKWSKAFIESLPDTSFLYANSGTRMFPIADGDGRIDRTRLMDVLTEIDTSGLPKEVIEEKKEIVSQIVKRFESGASVEEISKEFIVDSKINVEDVKLDKTIEELKADVARLEASVDELTKSSASKDTAIAEKDAEIARLTELSNTYETELTPLKEFKASIDAENTKKAKLEEVRNKFVEAGIEKGEEFYTENAEKLVALDEASLEFMIQEFKAFAAEKSAESASASKKTKIPAFNVDSEEISPEDLIEYLRNRNAKK